jgi:hypothetical protein
MLGSSAQRRRVLWDRRRLRAACEAVRGLWTRPRREAPRTNHKWGPLNGILRSAFSCCGGSFLKPNRGPWFDSCPNFVHLSHTPDRLRSTMIRLFKNLQRWSACHSFLGEFLEAR